MGYKRKTKVPTGPVQPKPQFVAVVYKDRAGTIESERSNGDWASFVGATKHEAVEAAIQAKNQWEAKPYSVQGYKVLVGKLTEVAQVPVKYELVKL
jgi:hypothetical protein